jgi:hypothetical protein
VVVVLPPELLLTSFAYFELETRNFPEISRFDATVDCHYLDIITADTC